MALDPVFGSTISTSITDETATLTDATVYGGANPARSTVAVFLELWKLDEDAAETAVTVSNSEPETVTSWSFTYTDDGWYRARMYIIEEFSIIVAYTTDDIVYYTDGNLYKAIQDSTGNLPTDTAFFELVTEYEDTVIDGNNVIAEYYDFVLVEYGKKCAGDANAEWARQQDCGSCDKLKLTESFLKKRGLVIAIQRFAAISQFSKAEELARKLETTCESC